MNLNHLDHVNDAQTLEVAPGDCIGSVYPSSLGKWSVNIRPYCSTLSRIIPRSRSPNSIETAHPVALPNQSHCDLIYSTHNLASSAWPRPRNQSSPDARFPIFNHMAQWNPYSILKNSLWINWFWSLFCNVCILCFIPGDGSAFIGFT